MEFWAYLNDSAKSMIQKTLEFWKNKGINVCDVEHFLYTMIVNKYPNVIKVFDHFKINYEEIAKDIENNNFGNKSSNNTSSKQKMGNMKFTDAFWSCISDAFLFINMNRAKEYSGQIVTIDHLFLGICISDSSKMAAYFNDRGITREVIINYMANLNDTDIVDNSGYLRIEERYSDENISNVGDSDDVTDTLERPIEDDDDEGNTGGKSFNKTKARKNNVKRTPILNQIGIDLTQQASCGKLGPIIGRADEIDTILEILCRKHKRNVLLLGDPGVGKTAIAEGVAIALNSGRVPLPLKNKRLIQLNTVDLVAGTRYRGDFEERIKFLMVELINNKNVILFIDEIHTVMGAGNGSGGLDMSNIFKPALAKGDIQVIGATTQDEFSKYLKKDAAFERRFHALTVNEPDEKDAYAILSGLKDTFEEYHKVTYNDKAINAAIRYSKQYMPDKFLPDKCIDLIDIAGARSKMNTMDLPDDIIKMQIDLSNIIAMKNKAASNEEFNLAAKYHTKENILREKLHNREKEYYASLEEDKVVISDTHIADIISRLTKIPTDKITEDESDKLLSLEDNIKKRLIGQDAAVSSVSRAIRRARTDLHDKKKPIGSFLFMGPTGVGKTELARTLAVELFGREDNLIKLDMSEYSERFDVSKLLGAPPGFVGYEEGGKLSEAVRKQPYSIILFDEIEKAHPDIYNILLQVLEDGVVTDAKGRTVYFNNSIIIMTSNIGAEKALTSNQVGFLKDSNEDMKSHITSTIMKEAKMNFRPEFLNRLDDMIAFQPLEHEHLRVIVDHTINKINQRIAHRDIIITITDDMREKIIEDGYDPKFGARPIKRSIQTLIEDYIADKLLRHIINDHMTVEVSYNKETKEITHSVIRDESCKQVNDDSSKEYYYSSESDDDNNYVVQMLKKLSNDFRGD